MSTLFQSVYTLSLFAYAREREIGEKKRDPVNFSPMVRVKENSNFNGSEQKKTIKLHNKRY